MKTTIDLSFFQDRKIRCQWTAIALMLALKAESIIQNSTKLDLTIPDIQKMLACGFNTAKRNLDILTDLKLIVRGRGWVEISELCKKLEG